MSNRDLGFTALGRFMAVERYRETCQRSSTNRPARPHTDRTGRLRPDLTRPGVGLELKGADAERYRKEL